MSDDFEKIKKEASTTIAANASSIYFLTYERDFNILFITFMFKIILSHTFVCVNTFYVLF